MRGCSVLVSLLVLQAPTALRGLWTHLYVGAEVTEGPRRRCGDTRLRGTGPCATAARCEGEAGLCLGCRGGVTADGATSPCVILNQICF